MKRLQVISDFTELGSGFKIAMKDMEIRGAGNLLGRDQSGVSFIIRKNPFSRVFWRRKSLTLSVLRVKLCNYRRYGREIIPPGLSVCGKTSVPGGGNIQQGELEKWQSKSRM